MTDVDKVEQLVRTDFARYVRIVAASCGSICAAEDAVAVAFAKAWERAARGEEFTNLAGWVMTVALRHTKSGWRRRRAEERALEKVAKERTDADLDEVIDLRVALAELSPRQLDAVMLYYFVGQDVASVAGLLHISEGTVKSALFRARAKLAPRLVVTELEA
jgi:RNA polymerase sigma-70 factor, ECF subfamily